MVKGDLKHFKNWVENVLTPECLQLGEVFLGNSVDI